MKTVSSVLLILLLAFSTGSAATAGATRGELKSFSELTGLVKDWDLSKTLIVLDDDDTVSMMACPSRDKCQYLGGPAWFSWQNSLLGTQSPYRVANTFPDLLVISGLLLAVNDMPFTEPSLPVALDTLAQGGARIMVETARGAGNVSATEAQFIKLEIAGADNLLAFLNRHAPTFGHYGLASLASPFMPCSIPGAQPITYRQGVMYLAGQHKGPMLACLLSRYAAEPGTSPITHILFADDTLENVTSVYDTFKTSDTYTVTALHYTALQAHKAALTEGDMAKTYQDQAYLRWHSLRATMELGLLDPALP